MIRNFFGLLRGGKTKQESKYSEEVYYAGRFPITFIDCEPTKDLLFEYEQFLETMSPHNSPFLFDQSTITVCSTRALAKALKSDAEYIDVHAFTEGPPSGPHQKITIDINHPQLLVHEFGHFIDKYAKGDTVWNFSNKTDFQNTYTNFWTAVSENDQILAANVQSLLNHSEAFALMFEQYCKETFPHISLTQDPSYNSEQYKHVYHQPGVSEHFKQTFSDLHCHRLGDRLSDLHETKQL